ncbi:MAG: hypothetical protein AAFY46_15395, partial [Planctomycetota bacterium]
GSQRIGVHAHAFPPHSSSRAASSIAIGLPRRFMPTVHGYWQAWAGIVGSERRNRAPVSPEAYRAFLKLRRGKPMAIDEAARLLECGGNA